MTVTIDGTTGVSAVQSGAVQAGDLATGAVTAGAMGIQTGRRNLIINGAMQVAQRGTTVSAITGAGYYAGPDRFRRSMNAGGGHAVTRERLSNDAPEGFVHSLKETVTTAGDESNTSWAWRPVNYRIEGQDLQHLKFGTSNAESVTLSFYVKSNKTGTASVVIYSYDSGGSSRTNTRRYTINAANTWEKKTLTFNGDTTTAIRNTNEIGFDILIYAESGPARNTQDNTSWGVGETDSAWYQCDLDVNNVNDFVMFTGFQLEVGTEASPFEHRTPAEELTGCQRYCFQLDGEDYGAMGIKDSLLEVQFPFPTTMRAQPTVHYSGTLGDYTVRSGGTNYTPTTFSQLGIRDLHYGWIRIHNASVGTVGYVTGNADGFIRFDSEL